MKYIHICIVLLCCIACQKEKMPLPNSVLGIGTHQGVLQVQNKGVSNEGAIVESATEIYYHSVSIEQGTREGSLLLHQNNTTIVLEYVNENQYRGIFMTQDKDCSTIEQYELYWAAEEKILKLEYKLESSCQRGKMQQKGLWEVKVEV